MKKLIISVILMFQICVFLLLLTACVASGSKHSEETRDVFFDKSDNYQSDLSETGIMNSESQNIATSEKSTPSKQESSKSDKDKDNQVIDSFSSKNTVIVDLSEKEADISEEKLNSDVSAKTEALDDELDAEWGN